MLTGKQANIDKANQVLSEMYKNNNYVPALLALSICKFLKKSPNDA